MRPSRKHRGDAKLQTLEAEQQQAIIERCNKGKYKDVVTWLKAEWDIETSVGALSDFYSWHQLKTEVDEVESHLDDLDQLVAESGLEIDVNKLRDTRSAIMMATASRKGDFKTFRGIYELLLKKEKNQISRDRNEIDKGKLELMQKKAAALDAVKDAVEAKPGAEDTAEDVQRRVMDVIDQVMGVQRKPATEKK